MRRRVGVAVAEAGERAGLVDEPMEVRLRRIDDITLAAFLPRGDADH